GKPTTLARRHRITHSAPKASASRRLSARRPPSRTPWWMRSGIWVFATSTSRSRRPRSGDCCATTASMSDDLLALAADLKGRGQPLALATVVRCERPTSAKPGARALIREDGSVCGWVGGACAEPVIVREALMALRDGRPRLIALVGDGDRGPGRTEGIVEYPMTCHSGGTLEIYVEPHLPKAVLVLVGHGPVIEALAALGGAADYDVVPVASITAAAELSRLRLTSRASVVVATHADSDEEALAHVLTADVGYVSLVASRRRAAVILERLKGRGGSSERLGRLTAPAVLGIGA